jgi:pantoate--beta-alanine ligase
MKVFSTSAEIYSHVLRERLEGKRVGLVPTMGALHEGHVSLVRQAKSNCDCGVATIFVNPTQFGPKEDLSKYPRTLGEDLEKLDQAGCDYVFTPTESQMYGVGHSTYVEPPQVSSRWEGEIRPGHFRGVCTIVLKLFQMIPADIAYFGRKDYQQLAVIRAMVRDLNIPVCIEACQTIREPDGLAMSSRNRYLSEEQRHRALGLIRALRIAERLVERGERDVQAVERAMRQELLAAPVDSIDYAAIVDPVTLEPISEIQASVVGIIAARLGSTRLIDNATIDCR